MADLREGDIVTLKAIVTRVAPYDGGQQISCRLLPRGKELGWLLQKETGFELHEAKFRVGDKVKLKDRPGHIDPWEIMTIYPNGQVAIQKRGQPVELNVLANLWRVK